VSTFTAIGKPVDYCVAIMPLCEIIMNTDK